MCTTPLIYNYSITIAGEKKRRRLIRSRYLSADNDRNLDIDLRQNGNRPSPYISQTAFTLTPPTGPNYNNIVIVVHGIGEMTVTC